MLAALHHRFLLCNQGRPAYTSPSFESGGNMRHLQTIPVIDLSDFHSESAEVRERCVQAIGRGLHKIGFISIIHHGVSGELIEDAYAKAEEFFLQPLALKQKYENLLPGDPRGFSSMGREHVRGVKAPDLKEFWHTGRETLENGEEQALYPSNPWPSEVAEFRETMLKLYDELEMVACYLLEAAAMHLGLPQFSMCDRVTDGNSVLRIAHYPPVPEGTDPSTFRSAPHEDIDFITLLCEATGDGLEIQQMDGSWLPVRNFPGQIIVNAGDMLQNLTNGYYRSTTHRVSNNNLDRKRRFSMPFFVHPRAEVDLRPIPEALRLTGGKSIFPPISAGSYFQQRLQEIGFGRPPQAK